MATLALMEQGATLGLEGEEFVVSKAGVPVEKLRIADVSRVMLYGSVALTPAATARLLRDGTETLFLTLHGNYRGRLASAFSKNVELRLRQFRAMDDPATRLALAREMVRGKVANQRNLLLRVQRDRKSETLASALLTMRRCGDQAGEAADPASLRGVEGTASAAFFAVFGEAIRNDKFRFGGRNRRPPRDPVNAMLSFGYVRAGVLVEGYLARTGLDPAIGVLHEPAFGRPSLALDLLEEFRTPLVDAVVLRMVNHRQVGPDDFETPAQREAEEILEGVDFDGGEFRERKEWPEGAVLLGATGRKIFFREFSKRLAEVVFHEAEGKRLTYEQAVESQVWMLARAIKGEGAYRAFIP
jgi:CRISPR-associated protein Cas1